MAQSNYEKSNISLIGEVLAKKHPEVATKIANLSQKEAMEVVSQSLTATESNDLVGNLFYFIAKQKVNNQSLKIVGNVFQEFENGSLIDVGAGINIVDTPLNAAPTSTIGNYQTDTDMATAWIGENTTNVNLLNVTYFATNAASKTIADLTTMRVTQTIPQTFARLSILSAIKLNEVLSIYRDRIDKAVELNKYELGNLLFSQFEPKNVYKFQNTNLINCLNEQLAPLIAELRRPSTKFNWGAEALNGVQTKKWSETLNEYCPNARIAPNSMQSNFMNCPEDLVILMNPKTSAEFLTQLQSPGVTMSNDKFISMDSRNNELFTILGLPVITTGVSYNRTVMPTTAGVAPTLNDTGAYVQKDGEILIIERSALQYALIADETVISDTSTKTFVRYAARLVQYEPVLESWKTGVKIVLDITNTKPIINVEQVQTTAPAA